jgi:hypothetical protein
VAAPQEREAMNNSQQGADQSSTNGEQLDWYYRLGDRERGPMTLAQLTDLVATSGELAREIVVKHHADGSWVPYESVDPATARRLHAGGSSVAAPTTVPQRNDQVIESNYAPRAASLVERSGHLRERLRANRPLVAGVLAWLCFNFVLWYALDPLHRTEHKYFQTITDAAQKARDSRKLDDAERGRVAASVTQEVKPIIDKLSKTAKASEPIQQHLLWAAKIQLPKLFSASGKDLGACDAIFQRHMYEAGRRMGINVSRPLTSVVFQ